MDAPAKPSTSGLSRDVRAILDRRREVWNLVPQRDKLTLLGATGISAIASLTATGIALLLGKFFKEVIALRGRPSPVVFRTAGLYLILLAGAYLLKETLQVVRKYLVQSTTTRLARDTTIKLVSHLLMVDLSALSRDRVGSLHGRISRSVEGFIKFVKLSFTDFIPAILTALFALIAGLYADWRIGLVMAAVIPTAVFITVRQVISQKGIRLELQRAREAMDGTVVEQLGGIEYIRAVNTHQLEARRTATAAEGLRAKELRHQIAMSAFDWAKSVNEGLFHILVLFFAIYLAATGRMDFGNILAFSVLFGNVMQPLREVHRIFEEAYESSIQVGVLMTMLGEPIDRSFGTVTKRPPRVGPEVPIVVAKDLSVDYRTPDGRTRRALDGVSMTIRHGETIGTAGRSGCGKSTWLKALMRLIHPSGGSVLIGGVPIDVVSREDLGKLIGYVSQSPFVFAGTVAENISYGCEGVTRADVERAAKMAHIHDEIMEMPGGYDAMLSERGNNLSGGQRQRLALARLSLRNPPLLILDEGTSALDNISERKIQLAIAEARADRTIIMVAHRLSTLRDADRILVFDDGRVVEEGTYDELVHQGGLFTELVQSAGDAHA